MVPEGVMSPKENRGHHDSHPMIDDMLLERIDAHIKSYPYRVAHYCKSVSKKHYLSNNLSFYMMWMSYIEKIISKQNKKSFCETCG